MLNGSLLPECQPAESRRAQAINASGIIRPMAVVEIRGTAGKDVGCRWSPEGIGQAGVGFDHDDEIAGPADGKAELSVLHAKGRISGQYYGIPEEGAPAAKR